MSPSTSHETDSVGVPTEKRQFLPSFDYFDRPFFERDGLKFRAGPVHFRFQLAASVEFNDNIFATSINTVSDLITRLTPTIEIGSGDFQTKAEDYFHLQYTPSYQEFLQNPQQSHVGQSLGAEGKLTFSRYSTDFALDYLQDNSPTATQTGRQGYKLLNFTWNNSYYLGAKTFIGAAVSVASQDYETGQSSITYSFAPQIGYAYSPKTTVYAGPYVGYASLGSGVSQTFEGLTAGFSYDTLRKVTLQGSLGIQARQFEGLAPGINPNFVTPIFNLTALWKVLTDSSLQISIDRDVQISDLGQGLTYTNTSAGVGWTQQITRTLSFRMNLGYQYLEYQSNAFLYPNGRTDQYIAGGPTLRYQFWRDAISIELYYLRQQRSSDLQNANFSINTYGVRLTYKF